MSDIQPINLAAAFDALLDRVQYDLCPNPEIQPTAKYKLERLERRRQIAKRNRVITAVYLGLDGEGGCSMEQVGTRFQLTRESVRQITNKVTERLAALDGVPRAELASVIRLVRDRVPTAKATITQELVQAGWWQEGRDLSGLVAAARVLLESESRSAGEELIEVVEEGVTYLVLRDQVDWPKQVSSAASRLVSHNGAATIAQVIETFVAAEQDRRVTFAKKARKDGKPVPTFGGKPKLHASFVADVLGTREAIWLGNDRSWFTLRDAKRNRLVNRLNKIFACYESAQLFDVSEAIKRSFQKSKEEELRLLPFDVLADLIRSLPGFSIENGEVTYRGEPLPGSILPTELAMVKFIAAHETGIRREKELEEGVINTVSRRVNPEDSEPVTKTLRELREDEPVVNPYGFSMALNFSPLILPVLSIGNGDPERVRGHYRLVGRLRAAA